MKISTIQNLKLALDAIEKALQGTDINVDITTHENRLHVITPSDESDWVASALSNHGFQPREIDRNSWNDTTTIEIDLKETS